MGESSDALKREILEKVARYIRLKVEEETAARATSHRVQYAGRVYDEDEVVRLVDSSLEFWLTYGRYSQEFEEELASFLGVNHCFLVNSGSSANLLAFMALTSERLGSRRISRGDEVITVAAGFPTTVAPIIQYGAVPVFVDIDIATANIDISYLGEAISPRTKAVMLAHTLGNPFRAREVREFCDRHGLWLVEDNCDALGSLYQGQYTGTFGDVATSSFYPAHHITTGEGGAVYTNNSKLARIVQSMRDWGRDCICPPGVDNTCGHRFDARFEALPAGYDHKYTYSEFGYNLKATDMQAAVGCAQLAKLPSFIETRRRNWSHLDDGVRGLTEEFILPEATPGSEPSWFGYLLTVREGARIARQDVVRFLESHGIQTRMLFAGNYVRQPCFDGMRRSGHGYRVIGDLRNTELLMKNAFWLGVYPGIMSERVEHMATVLRRSVGT